MTLPTTKRGFTLVELLVVIAIISFLTSIAYANFAVARTKTVDQRKKVDLASMHTAIAAFNLDNQRPPHMYDCSGSTCVVNDNRATMEIEDTANPENPQTESGKAFRATMEELRSGHYLPGIPQSPGGAGYSYYAYGTGSAAGAMVGTTMENDPPSTTGQDGTCRPFPNGNGVTLNTGKAHAWGAQNALAAAVQAVKLSFSFGGDTQTCTVLGDDGLSHEYPITDYHCSGVPPQNGDTDGNTGNGQGNNGLGGVQGDGGGHCTIVGDDGLTQELPLSDPRCQGGDGTPINGQNTCNPKDPSSCQSPNLCSQFNSQDYCLCTAY